MPNLSSMNYGKLWSENFLSGLTEHDLWLEIFEERFRRHVLNFILIAFFEFFFSDFVHHCNYRSSINIIVGALAISIASEPVGYALSTVKSSFWPLAEQLPSIDWGSQFGRSVVFWKLRDVSSFIYLRICAVGVLTRKDFETFTHMFHVHAHNSHRASVRKFYFRSRRGLQRESLIYSSHLLVQLLSKNPNKIIGAGLYLFERFLDWDIFWWRHFCSMKP